MVEALWGRSVSGSNSTIGHEFLDKTSEVYYHARRDREDLYRYTAALGGLERMFTIYEQPELTEDDRIVQSKRTVICLGHGSQQDSLRTPELEEGRLFTGIAFSKATYLLPWAIHTIPPGAITQNRPQGQLTREGKKPVAREFAKTVR